MNTQINPYQVSWAIIQPVSGILTKKDASIIKKQLGLCNKKRALIHAPTRERATEIAKSLTDKLSKRYSVIVITDKQYGMNVQPTTKQQREIFYV